MENALFLRNKIAEFIHLVAINPCNIRAQGVLKKSGGSSISE